jgi:predicted peptidase
MKSVFASVVILLTSLSVWAYRPISDDKLQEIIESFNYTPNVQITRKAGSSCSGLDLEFTTTYPQRDTALLIKAKLFIPTQTTSTETDLIAAQFPIVFILPPLGGANRLDMMMGETICKNKMAAMLITTNLTGLDQSTLVPVTDHDHTHRRVASAIKGGLIVARTYPAINTEKVGLFGASLGGILGSVAYSVLPEISAATFLVNGADVPHILTNSDQGPVVKLKAERMREQGFTTSEQYEQFLNDNLEIDPLHFVKLIQPETIKLFLSQKDKSVPTQDQMLYYEALGRPSETKFYMIGHGETIFAVMGIGNGKQQIAEWFLNRFALRNPRLNPSINELLNPRF